MRRIVLAGILCTLSTAAWADPPNVGERMVASNAIICDTRDQVMDLYTASKQDDGKGIITKYHEYNALIDKAGEPTCNIQAVLGAPVKSVEDLGVSHGSVHGWLVELQGAQGVTGWALYGEQVQLPGVEV
jgi:hypothetical protein